MASRLELQTTLEALLGSKNVYFQPPESVKMSYPAIVYAREKFNTEYADNVLYRLTHAYNVTLIDKNPDSEFVDKIAALPMCQFDRHYAADNLNHDVFILYF
jgi:hypothetical protein